MGSLFVNLLGGFQAAGPRAENVLLFERKKARALLAVLALDPGRMMPRGKLTALLWEEQSEEVARHGLRQCLLDLRQALAKRKIEAVQTEGDSIGLVRSRVVVDVACFERHLAHGTPKALEDAVALYRGDLLEGFSLEERTFEDWLHLERERLRSQAVVALRKLLSHHVRERTTDIAVQIALRLLTFESFDETVHRTLMRLYAESGRRGAAMRQYEDCVEVLGRELGVEPDAETRDLYRRLIFQGVRPPAVPRTPRTAPTPGARAPRTHGIYTTLRGTPLVGRMAELEWLDGLRERAHRGQVQLALMVGEAGIGKSRLVTEFAARAPHRRAELLLGRGREGEDVMPFAPWVEALRGALSDELLGRLPPVTRLDLARLFPEIADSPVLPPGGLDDGPRIFEAVAYLLRELARDSALIIVIEDLHWCDDMTVRLLRFLPRRLQGQPILLAGTARPEEMADGVGGPAFLDVLHRDPSCSPRTLGPLSRDEATQLFRALLASSRDGALEEALVERVWGLSEGNPFVVVECARAAQHGRGPSRDDPLELPEQVRALTARSFVGLSDGASRLADVAAVIGRDLDLAVLRHAAGLTEHELADGVEELVRRRVLREVDGHFDFGHDRVREVGYSRLLEPRRVLLHRRVGEAMEAVYAGELGPYCAIIGAHYRRAGVWPEACEYQARAGFDALERGAGREALACFDYTLQAVAQLPDAEYWRELSVRVRLAANRASKVTGNYERGRPYLVVAERVAEKLPDRRWQGRVAVAMSSCLRPIGALEEALRFGHTALDIARQTENRPLEVAAQFVLAMSESTAGQFRQSLQRLTPLLSIAPLSGVGRDVHAR